MLQYRECTRFFSMGGGGGGPSGGNQTPNPRLMLTGNLATPTPFLRCFSLLSSHVFSTSSPYRSGTCITQHCRKKNSLATPSSPFLPLLPHLLPFLPLLPHLLPLSTAAPSPPPPFYRCSLTSSPFLPLLPHLLPPSTAAPSPPPPFYRCSLTSSPFLPLLMCMCCRVARCLPRRIIHYSFYSRRD